MHLTPRIQKAIKIIFYFFTSLSVFTLLSVFGFLNFLRPFEFTTSFGCVGGGRICDLIPYEVFVLPLVILQAVFLVLFIKVSSLRTKPAKRRLIGASVIIMLILLFMISLNNARCKSKNAALMSDLKQISTAQELYFIEFGRYADNFEELIESKILSYIIYDPYTGLPYADADGSGLEGGDDDPNTYYIQAFVHQPAYKWCLRQSEGYWFYCKEPGKCTRK